VERGDWAVCLEKQEEEGVFWGIISLNLHCVYIQSRQNISNE
jgi:hypothetical protein